MQPRKIALMLPLALLLAACEGEAGPTGPAGPQGPQGPAGPAGAQGPAGPGVTYLIAEGPINTGLMATTFANTGGIAPGVLCYLSHANAPGSWLSWETDSAVGTSCGVVQNTAGEYSGRALIPPAYINTGWSMRVILFWSNG